MTDNVPLLVIPCHKNVHISIYRLYQDYDLAETHLAQHFQSNIV